MKIRINYLILSHLTLRFILFHWKLFSASVRSVSACPAGRGCRIIFFSSRLLSTSLLWLYLFIYLELFSHARTYQVKLSSKLFNSRNRHWYRLQRRSSLPAGTLSHANLAPGLFDALLWNWVQTFCTTLTLFPWYPR